MDESARRLVGKDASHMARELEESQLKPARVICLLLLSNYEDVLVLKDVVCIRDWRPQEEIHLAFPFLKLVGSPGRIEFVSTSMTFSYSASSGLVKVAEIIK